MHTFTSSLSGMLAIGLVLVIIMYVYAIIGMSLFKYVQHAYNGEITSTVGLSHVQMLEPDNHLDDVLNFETCGQSLLLLFQLSTRAGWDRVLAGLGYSLIAIVYILSYLLLTWFIIINMFIALILENFSEITEDLVQGLTQDDIDRYFNVWQKYDEETTGYIHVDQVSEFIAYIGEPLRIPQPNSDLVSQINIPVNGDQKVHYKDVFECLAKKFFGI